MTDIKREIKFRGISTTTGEWVYGYFIKAKTGYCEITYQHKLPQLYQFVRQNVVPDSVGQFIGLPDKNGVEIYESDIVEVEYGSGKVIFHAGCFMIEWIDDPEANMELLSMRNARFGHVREDLVVIGNIYEHPHLLIPKP